MSEETKIIDDNYGYGHDYDWDEEGRSSRSPKRKKNSHVVWIVIGAIIVVGLVVFLILFFNKKGKDELNKDELGEFGRDIQLTNRLIEGDTPEEVIVEEEKTAAPSEDEMRALIEKIIQEHNGNTAPSTPLPGNIPFPGSNADDYERELNRYMQEYEQELNKYMKDYEKIMDNFMNEYEQEFEKIMGSF